MKHLLFILLTVLVIGCSEKNNPVISNTEQTYFIQYLVATSSPTSIKCDGMLYSDLAYYTDTLWYSSGGYIHKGARVIIEAKQVAGLIQWTVVEVLEGQGINRKVIYSNGGMGYAKIDTTL